MARHLVHFYLEGGQDVALEVESLEVQVTDDAQIAGYTIGNVPETRISYLYFKPSAIIGIKSILLEADEPDESDSI